MSSQSLNKPRDSKSYLEKDLAMSNEKHSLGSKYSPVSIEDMKLRFIMRDLIRERGITITALSRATKVPLQTLHGWLQGSEPRSLKQVKNVADYFDVDLDYLCFGIEEKQAKKISDFEDEINAGVFEVVLRRVKK